MKRKFITFFVSVTLGAAAGYSQSLPADTAQVIQKEEKLGGVTVTSRTTTRRIGGAMNGQLITQQELFRAACCNLGESFATNPSVDVSYSDAATGAKQIRLLGLSGTYVQMMTEQLTDFRGAAQPFALDYVPGPFMKSIQVSKGTATVKNGAESITGQINVEYKKPDDAPQLNVNLYGDTKSRYEANADANIHLNKDLSTILLAHFENDWGSHDDNGDGFTDRPNRRQGQLMNRWKYIGNGYLMHAGFSLLTEKREGGQLGSLHHSPAALNNTPSTHLSPYTIHLATDRASAYMKHAFILNPEQQTNIALMANASIHTTDADYGMKHYGVNNKTMAAQLMFESNFTPLHNLSAGVSFDYDYLKSSWREMRDAGNGSTAEMALDPRDSERTVGAYAQYTYNLNERVVVMAGLRLDHSSLYDWYLTPRLHLKWQPIDLIGLRASVGRGLRTVHPLAEMHYLLGSGRTLVIDERQQEAAWNAGLSAALNIPVGGKTLKLNADYYYTTFQRQAIVDYESDASLIRITPLDGRSYSHTLQVDATYPLLRGFTLTAAYRLNDVKQTIAGRLMERPLTSRYKGLLTASYRTPLELWQIDATLQLNGGGRIIGDERFSGYEQLSAQVTREFRHFALYVGGENLTGFRQKNPIRGADNPYDRQFESTLVWGPVHGRMFYAGIRLHLEKLTN
ncbi:MAG: TonB-dependent receptor [Prevotella sp.]|nr:TonB-dependent receptor [Prevotella sp.]